MARSPGPSPLDPFIPDPDVAECVATSIQAPAALVFEVARGMDLRSLPLVRGIFWLRERLLGATPQPPRLPQGMLQELLGLGWGLLIDQPPRLVAGGAVCQPWQADVVFQPVAPSRFAAYAEPDRVKIAWTLECRPLGPVWTRFVTETRAVATDAKARAKFRRYWRWARFGIVGIRLLLLPAVRRQAEQRWRRTRGCT